MSTKVVSGSGAILEPEFSEDYSVSKINIIDGGAGYDQLDPPKIEILNTEPPIIEGIFYPHIYEGTIKHISIINPGLGYYPKRIGIATTSQTEHKKDIIMEVGGGIGSAIYENGYNVAITTDISGLSSSIVPNYSGYQNMFWGFNDPYIPTNFTSGSGVDAKFSVFIVYNSSTGSPISTSLILRDGGRGYSVGDTVSISGTYIGGDTPENDLSFNVSKVSSTRISSESNVVYTNIPANSTIGIGTGAIVDISRDSEGDISKVSLVFGGSNYELTDNITIAGTYIGGSTPEDNLYLSPILLGTDELPETLYVEKIDNNNFKVAGISTGNIIDLDQLGFGENSFYIEDPNPNTIITIDNVIQTPVYKTDLSLILDNDMEDFDTVVYSQNDISSLVLNDILNIGDEYMLVKNIGVAGTNDVIVERGILGSIAGIHSAGDIIYVAKGNYNIIKDTIYFISPPYGPTGLSGLEVNSTFSGRVFSRKFDPYTPNDKNIIFDDISNQFTGIAATEFLLKSNGEDVVGIFTSTNSIVGGSGGVDINNNPLILINNVPQIGGDDYVIDTPGTNTIRFISGVPLAGKITNVSFNSGYGYLPLVGASATVSVSAAGTISNVYLTGEGKGYRTPPTISIASTVGYGASIKSTIGVGGTITSLEIVNPGIGYTIQALPEVRIDVPQNYYSLPLKYAEGYSGVGTNAKVSVIVGNGSSIISFNLDNPGFGYKVGDVLVAPGISTDPSATNLEEFKITVLETYTDSFAGWYPGQFIQFDDISQYFNGLKRRFTLTITIFGQKQIISLKSNGNISLTNNLFVFINDILQIPGESYTFTGTRIIFKEPPKSGSKCNILFFKGSDLDVEQVEPLLTIKEGDDVQIDENITDPFDIAQFTRTVKDIIATDILDTFTYDSIGISTDQTKLRPLNWTKQTQDKVINGVLYPKSRPNLKSKIIPSAKVIKNINKTDTEIYIDSAIPLFSDLDETRNLVEGNRNVIVLNNKTITTPIIKSVVSTSGTISSIDILDGGSGYENVKNPTVSISSRFITRKDPIYNWSENIGIITSHQLNSIGYGTGYIAVGNSGLNYISYDGENWYSGIGTSGETTLSDAIGYGNTYIIVGGGAKIFKSVGLGTDIEWSSIKILTSTKDILGKLTIDPSNYSGDFKEISYDPSSETFVVVGSSGGLFNAIGINTNGFFENKILSFDFNSVAFGNGIFSVVGDFGNILYSQNGETWNTITTKPTLQNLNSVIWDGKNFVAAGNNSTVAISTNSISWKLIQNVNINSNILKLNYNNNLYTAIDSNGDLYFSLNLSYWTRRDVSENKIVDVLSFGNGDTERYISVGSSGYISYSIPVINNAVAISTTLNGQLTQIEIVNGGFGYPTTISTPTIVETEPLESEQLYSIKAKGDYGSIIDVTVYDTGNVGFGTTSPAIEFVLKSDNFPVLLPTMEYDPLKVGDYFTIFDSNIISGHALTCISINNGGMSNYPQSKVGTTTSFIDGIYEVGYITPPSLGIATVGCFFVPIPEIGADKIQVNIGINTTGFYGRYSFGIIYDYQNRARENPVRFSVNSDNGLIGLTSGPMIYRTRGIV